MFPSERRIVLLLLLGAGLVLATGCVEHAYDRDNHPSYEEIPPPAGTAPQSGAVWAGNTASGSFLFFDRKARGVGDLVTVVVVENVSARGSASTSLGSSGAIDASVASDVGFSDAMLQAFRWFFRALGVDGPGVGVPSGQSVNALRSDKQNDFEGDGQTTRDGSFNAIVTCRVIRELPGHVFHVRGRRSLIVNHELQLLTVEGLVRREDIGINNTVLSTALAEAKLAFDGMGVIDDKQRPSLMARFFDWVYPF